MTVLLSPAESNRELKLELEHSGIRCLTWPSLAVGPPTDNSQLHEAIDNLFGYDWLILKNARAAEYFLRDFVESHRADELDQLRVLTIVSETAEKAAEFQIHVDIALDRFAQNEVFPAVESYVAEGNLARLNLLVPCAKVVREPFEEQFENAGARVDSIAAYRTTASSDELARIKALLAGEGIDFVVFANHPEIDQLAMVSDTDDLPRLLANINVVCADESTTEEAARFGLVRVLTATEPSAVAIVEVIQQTSGE
jgi:uroporphyrinogen III methyltransferase/synthase